MTILDGVNYSKNVRERERETLNGNDTADDDLDGVIWSGAV